MTDDKAITVVNIASPALTLEQAKARYGAMVDFVKSILRNGVDYGTIPGTDKPTLYKPGAEKLNTFFGLHASFAVMSCVENWEQGFFYFHYKCQLHKEGILIAESEGSANSKESKYRWRYVPDFKATEAQKSAAVRSEKKISKAGKSYTMLTIENDDPFSIVNTLQKMAQKRAFVAATLLAVNGSEFFTQDLEDTVEGEYTETPSPPPPSPAGNGHQSPPPVAQPVAVETSLFQSPPQPQQSQPEQGKPKPAAYFRIGTRKWQEHATALAKDCAYFRDKDAGPDMYHITGAAKKLGFGEVTEDSWPTLLDALTQYARENAVKQEQA